MEDESSIGIDAIYIFRERESMCVCVCVEEEDVRQLWSTFIKTVII